MGSEPPQGPAAEAIARADALVVAAGAGMGVDSGLPDFRGPEGFWRAYPAYAKLGLRFEALANPRWFARDPTLAWGFYGHRLGLYRRTSPREGFAVVRRLAAPLRHGFFAVASNVDGHFQRAGVPAERGAGKAVPTIRFFSEGLVRTRGATLVRVNPREPEVPAGQIGLALGALQAVLVVEGTVSSAGSGHESARSTSSG